MKYYLSGMMRPLPEHNFPMFKKVSAQLRADGMDIISPHEYGNGETDTRGQLMTEDLLLILQQCDGIICLPGWQNSPGASAEVAVAFGTEKPVYEYVPDEVGNLLGYHLIESPVVSVTVPRELQYKKGIPLIGLCGYAQVGKDTVASFLIQRGWTRVAFADALRDVLYALNPTVKADSSFATLDASSKAWVNGDSVTTQGLVNEVGWEVAKKLGHDDNDYTIRKYLQRLGTEAGREVIGQNLWVGMGEEKIEAAGTPVVVTDCRFPNEISLIKRRKGTLIWIERPGIQAVNAHTSEHSVSRDDCDLVLNNNGTFQDLYRKIEGIVAKPPYHSDPKPEWLSKESDTIRLIK